MPPRAFIAREENAMPGLKASKDRLSLFLRANIAGDLKFKPVLTYHSKIPGALKIYAKCTLPIFYKWDSKAWRTADLWQYGLPNMWSPLLRPTSQKKRLFSKYYCSFDNALDHPWALMEMHMGWMLVSYLLMQHTFCRPWVKESF